MLCRSVWPLAGGDRGGEDGAGLEANRLLRGVVARLGEVLQAGVTLVPISAQLELFCPPYNPTLKFMNVSWSCSS